MENNVFKFHVRNLSFGWCRILMLINDKEIRYNASYICANPLTTLINACAELKDECSLCYLDSEEGCYSVKWENEPGKLSINMTLKKNNMLHLNIINDHNGYYHEEWNETVPFNVFVQAIVYEGYRVLNAFGLVGYRCSWQNEEDFPLTNLLRITGHDNETSNGDSFTTDITNEIKAIEKNIAHLKISKETFMDRCIIYYESWQIQCCGDPFSVGDTIEWRCTMPTEIRNAHGIILDLEEDHHGFSTHTVTGTVTKILAERSEFPKGQREVWYHKAEVIIDKLEHADGWESDVKDDDNFDRTFWGYVVELRDAVVKPLYKYEEQGYI